MDKIKLKELINSSNWLKEWKIGTNITSYIKNGVCEWLYIIKNASPNDKILVGKLGVDEYCVFDKNNNAINLYRSSTKKAGLSLATYNQCVVTFISFGILEYEDDYYSVSQEFIKHVLEQKNNDDETIVYGYIRKKITSLFNKFLLKPIEEFLSNSNSFEEEKNFYNQSTRFWFTILLNFDSLENNSYIIKELNKKQPDEWFLEVTEKILSNDTETKNIFIDVTKKICDLLGIKNVAWKFLDIQDLMNRNENQHSKADFEIVNKLGKANIKILTEIVNFKQFIQLSHDIRYTIPIFQRFYTWDPYMIIGLLNNMIIDSENTDNTNKFSFLNSLVIIQQGNMFNIVDGQQRIISMLLILLALSRKAKYINATASLEMIKNLNGYNWSIKDFLDDFKKSNNEYYGDLYNLFFNEKQYSIENKGLSKQFYKNYNEIVQKVDEYFNVSNIDNFVKYFLESVFLNINILNDKRTDANTKIFQNLNRYSKRLGVLDLIRNKIYEIETDEEFVVKLFNDTVFEYFRKSKKNDEDLKELILFIDSWFVKEEKNEELDKISSEYYDDTTKTYEKFNFLLSIISKNQDTESKKEELVYKIINQIFFYEYAKTGSINKIEAILEKAYENNEKNDIYKNLVYNASEFKKHTKLPFINFQIFHITNGGSKTVYIPLIWKLIEISELLNEDKNIDTRLEILSKVLHKIEKFSIIWDIYFEGQSFSKQIINIVKSTLYKVDKLNENISEMIYEKLISLFSYERIDKIKNCSNVLKEQYREQLDQVFNKDWEQGIKIKEINNKLYKLIIGRVYLGLNNTKQPFYYEKPASQEQKELEIDFVNYSYEHVLPKNPKEEIKEIFEWKDNKNNYLTYVHKIGNGILLNLNDNKVLGNKEKKEYKINGIENKTSRYISMTTVDEQTLEIDQANWEIKILPNDDNDEIQKHIDDIKNKINVRTEQILDAYVYIIFDEIKTSK
ncbi:GmrSD restriction endonuclease domain-containing protein [Mycoplasma zalophi]|uniref:GmrSD restriction endonuclease domain-containing protein n=1 Tax=Mycoplasma zalophi TaxID=191287 RepID=UPI001C114373|nr:DUF262 domain-containing protein [Mycoplasma zalophi]MBU4690825.1 DUF262 domain-containing HNH endonuclease family protein [Mycoplasma zalophi]